MNYTIFSGKGKLPAARSAPFGARTEAEKRREQRRCGKARRRGLFAAAHGVPDRAARLDDLHAVAVDVDVAAVLGAVARKSPRDAQRVAGMMIVAVDADLFRVRAGDPDADGVRAVVYVDPGLVPAREHFADGLALNRDRFAVPLQ